jgi:hypothetical protein
MNSRNVPNGIPRNIRPTVRGLITQDLGYCCPWAFFRLFRRSSEIALRLGFAKRTINVHRAQAEGCEDCAGCLRKKGIVR